MKRTFIPFVLIVTLMAVPISLAGQKSDLPGIWKVDRTKLPDPGGMPVLVKISIDIKGDTLLTERSYDTGDGQEYPFTEKLSLDNKEYSIVIYDMPRKIKAAWSEPDNALIFESTTTFYGSSGAAEDFVSKETWKVDKQAGTLTISYINKVSAGEFAGALVFNKE